MAQLIGKKCIRCGDRISSELEAQFCPACGLPVHNQCIAPSSESSCLMCGGTGPAPQTASIERTQEAAPSADILENENVNKTKTATAFVRYGFILGMLVGIIFWNWLKTKLPREYSKGSDLLIFGMIFVTGMVSCTIGISIGKLLEMIVCRRELSRNH